MARAGVLEGAVAGLCVVLLVVTRESAAPSKWGAVTLTGVEDSTGRTLTTEAIKSAGLADDGALSGSDIAVLNSAGSLQPGTAKRSRAGRLPAYIQVAQRRAMRSGDDADGQYADAVPGEIVTVRDVTDVPASRTSAVKAKKMLDDLNKGFAKSMQRYLTGDDKVGGEAVTRAIDSRSASFLANTGDMGKAIGATVEKKILDLADQQHLHEQQGLVKSQGGGAEIPLEAHSGTHTRDLDFKSLFHAKNRAVAHSPDAGTREGVLHTDQGYVLRVDPGAVARSSPVRPLTAKAHLTMLSGGSAHHARRAPHAAGADFATKHGRDETRRIQRRLQARRAAQLQLKRTMGDRHVERLNVVVRQGKKVKQPPLHFSKGTKVLFADLQNAARLHLPRPATFSKPFGGASPQPLPVQMAAFYRDGPHPDDAVARVLKQQLDSINYAQDRFHYADAVYHFTPQW